MDRPYYKPAQVERYSRYSDETPPLVIAGLVLGGFVATVALGALWMLCII